MEIFVFEIFLGENFFDPCPLGRVRGEGGKVGDGVREVTGEAEMSNYVYGSIMLKIILVALLTHQKTEIKEKSQTFGQFGAPQYAMENECFTAPSKSTGWFLLLFCPKNDLV